MDGYALTISRKIYKRLLTVVTSGQREIDFYFSHYKLR